MKRNVLTILAMLLVLGVAFQAKAQGPYVLNWTQNLNGSGNTVLTTPSVTNSQSVATALAFFTTYTCLFTLNGGNLNIERQNITPAGPGGATAYYGGPVSVQTGGTNVNFLAWLNPSAQAGSAESI